MSVWDELKRRNVVKVGVAYAIVAWIVIQVTAIVLPTFSAPPWLAKSVTLLMILGLPIVLVVAWAFEITPDGIKRTHEVPRERSVTHLTGQKLTYLVVGLLVLAVAFLVVDNYVLPRSGARPPASQASATPPEAAVATSAAARLPPQRPSPRASVAVLPCANLSPNEDEAYFAEGIHEEILAQLAKFRNLSVRSRTSVLRYENTKLPIPEIAKELKVSDVMECSVRYADKRIRVTTQLIDAATDRHIWADSYERKFADIFAIQADIAMRVANALETEFSAAEQARIQQIPTKSTDAYALFLRAVALPAADPHIHEILDEALKIDPDFGLAHAVQAFLYSQTLTGTIYGTATDPARRAKLEALVREHADRALALDADSPPANAAIASLDFYHWRWTEARRSFEKSVRSAPSGAAISYVWLSAFSGQNDDAIRIAREILTANPNIPGFLSVLGLAQAYAGEDDLAIKNLRLGLGATKIRPETMPFVVSLAAIDVANSNKDAALRLLDSTGLQPTELQPIATGVDMAHVYALAGRPEPAEKMVALLKTRAANGIDVGAGLWAEAYVAVADYASALKWLAVAADEVANHELDGGFYALMDMKTNLAEDAALKRPEFVKALSRIKGD